MYITPMLLHQSSKPFTDDKYLTELKLDGIRLILHKGMNGKVRLYTRHNNEVTARFPELKDVDLPAGTTLDGELIATGDDGKPDFELVMQRFMSTKSSIPISYVVFDILKHEGESTTRLPLIDRKVLLEDVVEKDTSLLSKMRYVEGNGETYYDLVEKQSLEGIVLKKKESSYQVGKRSHSWLKVINYQYADVLLSGYRKSKFGWLLTYLDGAYAGIMELGVPPAVRGEVYQYPIQKETKDFKYLENPLPIHVRYRNKTKSGLLRLPSYLSSPL